MSPDRWAAIGCGLFVLACMAYVVCEAHKTPVTPPTEDQRALLAAWSRAADNRRTRFANQTHQEDSP